MSNNPNKREKMRRIMALVLVIFLLISVFGSLLYYLITPVFASDTPTIDTSVDNKLIRVGLMYGSNVTVGFETDAPYGFVVNKVNRTGDLTSEPLWELDQTKVSCTIDANLSKSAMTYSKASAASSAVIGGYHVEIGEGLSQEDTQILITAFEGIFSNLGLYAIPSFIDNGYRIRVGQFSSETIAAVCASTLASQIPDLPMKVVTPTNTAVSLVDPYTDKILFEYDCGDITALGLTPQNSPDGERAYLVTPAKKLYDGTFMFRRYISGAIDGVSLTDIIPLGEYIKGVVPYEISSSWHIEAQKAFAISVRSFTLAGARHENSYQVDICNSSHCQVYGGRAKITETVEKAVDETAGLVMVYDGKIATAYYSAVAGGVTVSSYDAWGFQHIPYLVAVETPWEIYTNHTYGVWTAEVSPRELCEYLRSKGYTSLRGEIQSINIDKFAENSTYIRELTFTDTYGTRVTIKTTETIYLALAKYVKSANFVVGIGQVEADRAQFHTVALDSLMARSSYSTFPLDASNNVSVITSSGVNEISLDQNYVRTANGDFLLGGVTSTHETVTVYAENENNFIFAGKGWGHGVGISQIGLRDLANLGYKAQDILPKYLTGVEIVNWSDVFE